jgi:SpoVK/Ycf46/Vps4 family AAA+-type ATPase
MSAVRPEEQFQIRLSDQDFRNLVAQALDSNLIYTSGYREDVTVEVENIDWSDSWDLDVVINVEKRDE